MTEACGTCDTLWRLYGLAVDHLQGLVGKHSDARGKGDRQTVEILTHEVAIAEASLRAVRRELGHHDRRRHGGRPEGQESKGEQKPGQAK